MSKKSGKKVEGGGLLGLGGLLGGLGTLIENLGELAEKGEELRKSGELRSSDGKLRGVYGFNVKVGLGDEGIKVEPFGNVHKDAKTGAAVIDEIREPMVDVFEEEDHVLVIAEMPGVGGEGVRLELNGDILVIAAERGNMKYRKEVLLPAAFPAEKMSQTCHNGVLEVKFTR